MVGRLGAHTVLAATHAGQGEGKQGNAHVPIQHLHLVGGDAKGTRDRLDYAGDPHVHKRVRYKTSSSGP